MQVEKRKAENSGCAALFGAENNDIGLKVPFMEPYIR